MAAAAMGAACSRDKDANHRRWSQHVPVPVNLHIYDIGTSRQIQFVNALLRHLHTGAFHCGVEVYGCEWSYSDVAYAPGECPVGTGIFSCQPKHCEGHSYCESIPMGSTSMSEVEVGALLGLLRAEWPVYAYNTLRKNCCHFSDEMCHRLGVGSIPSWVMNLAGAGAAVVAAGDTVCCRTMGQQGTLLCCGPPGSGRPNNGGEDTEVVNVEALPVLPPFTSPNSRRTRAAARARGLAGKDSENEEERDHRRRA